MGGCKIAKFVKVFSLESFPLYGITLNFCFVVMLATSIKFYHLVLLELSHFCSYNVSTDHCLQSKCTQVTINWHVSTSDSGMVGDSGAAATV